MMNVRNKYIVLNSEERLFNLILHILKNLFFASNLDSNIYFILRHFQLKNSHSGCNLYTIGNFKMLWWCGALANFSAPRVM